jgi:superfamily II DNA or RNA helicase
MICARPTRSLIRWIQMAGRILRPFDGKERAVILDHSGTSKNLGYPTDDLPLELDDGKPKISGVHEKEEPLPKACPSCKFMKPAKVHKCPQCGFAPERQSRIEVGDGTLQKLDRKTRIARATTEEKEQIYAEILGYCKERGMKAGFAYYACKDIFGSAPRTRLNAMTPSDYTRGLLRSLFNKRKKERDAELREIRA